MIEKRQSASHTREAKNENLRRQNAELVTIPTTRTGTPGPVRTAHTGTTLGTAKTALRTRCLRPGFVHRQCTTFDALAVECLNRSQSLRLRTHLDKPEALRALRFSVGNDLRRRYSSVRGKHLLQITRLDAITQVADVKLIAHLNDSPVEGCENYQLTIAGEPADVQRSQRRRRHG